MLNKVKAFDCSKLSDLIDGKKITKADIVRKSGMARPTLDWILEGKDFKVSNLIAICNAVSKPVSYFFNESNIVVGETHTTDHSGTSIYGDVSNIHNDNSCCDSKPDSGTEEKVALLEKHVAALESNLRDKDEIIRLLREKENK